MPSCRGSEGERINRVIAARAEATGISFDEMRDELLEMVSLKRMVTADDIASMALFLVSDAGRNISGQPLSVCGHVQALVSTSRSNTMSKVGVIGAGLIGRAWAMVFARAGHEVALYDGVEAALPAAMETIKHRLADLNAAGLIDDPSGTLDKITPVTRIEEAAKDAVYIQENVPETVQHKQLMFATLDVLAPADAILASSTSTIPASAFTESLNGRARCLVAHPVNPPYLVPLVELSPAPWTSPDVVRARGSSGGVRPGADRCHARGAGLHPQPAAGGASGRGLPACRGRVCVDGRSRQDAGAWAGLALVVHGAVRDHRPQCARRRARLRDALRRALLPRCRSAQADPRKWSGAVLDRIEQDRRKNVKPDDLDARQAWRDRRLMALAAHKKLMDRNEGE